MKEVVMIIELVKYYVVILLFDFLFFERMKSMIISNYRDKLPKDIKMSDIVSYLKIFKLRLMFVFLISIALLISKSYKTSDIAFVIVSMLVLSLIAYQNWLVVNAGISKVSLESE